MSSESRESKRFGDYVQDSARSADRDRIKSRLHDAVEAANKKVSRGQHSESGRILRAVIIPALQRLDYTKPLRQYHADLHHDDDLPWHWQEFRCFLNDPDRYVENVDDNGRGNEARVIERALESTESITTHVGITARELQNKVDVHGFNTKIGEHLQDYEMDLGSPVRGVTTQSGSLKTLFTGGTGNGKSTAVECEVEDFYQSNFKDVGPEFKILDIVGLRDGENWFYDVPQKQPGLKDIRVEMGLAETFEESDEMAQPELEILVPLTPGLSEQELPYDTDGEEFTVRPFVVPASEIEMTVLVSFVSSRLSDGQEETIRSAYEAVNREKSDWSLKDLADEIQSRDEVTPKDKTTAVNVLRSLQDKGFIRTRDHKYCLDWRDIFTDTKTISVFSQSFCDSDIGRYMVLAYLIEAIATKRERMKDIPQCVLVMRELWKVAPHKQRQIGYEEVDALQEGIAKTLTGIMRENRHNGIHVVADTQDASDLEKAVRQMFNRYVVFNGTYDLIKDIFSWTYNSRYKAFLNTLSERAGEAGIVGMVEPAVENRHIEFLSPVRYAPPSHHHRVAPGDSEDVGIAPDTTGWHGRARHHDHEELRRPCDVERVEWDDELPSDLEISSASTSPGRPDPETEPVAAFVDRCTLPADIGSYTHKRDLYDAFNEFLRKHKKDRWDFDESNQQVRFGKRFKKAFPEDVQNKERQGEYAFVGVVMTEEGKQLLRNARNEVESTATPIMSDD